jgi:hypothetical protein
VKLLGALEDQHLNLKQDGKPKKAVAATAAAAAGTKAKRGGEAAAAAASGEEQAPGQKRPRKA